MDGLLAQQLADVREALSEASRLIGTALSSPPSDIQADPQAATTWVPEASADAAVKIDGAALSVIGQQHQGAADYFQAHNARTHSQVDAFLGSLGPIFGDFRAAGREVLARRRADYDAQASGHGDVASGLSKVVAAWQGHEQGAAQQMRDVADS